MKRRKQRLKRKKKKMPLNKSRVTKFVDLKGIPKDLLDDTAEEVGEFIIAKILEDAGSGRSSVTGRNWSKLSPAYKAIKASQSSSTRANLELKGDLLDDLDWRLNGRRVEVGWFGGGEQVLKAFNHNTGDTLPKRQSITGPKQSFRPGISKEVDAIIDEILEAEDGDD